MADNIGSTRLLAKVFGVLVRAVEIAYLVCLCVYLHRFNGLEGKYPFNLHVLGMSLACICMTEGVVAFSTAEALVGVSHRAAKILHGTMHLLTLVFIITGLVAIFRNHALAFPKPILPLYSTHSWIGLFSIILFGSVGILGTVFYGFGVASDNTKKFLMPYKRVLGYASYFSFLAAMMAGLEEKQTFTQGKPYSSDHRIIATMGILLPILGVCVGLHIQAATNVRALTTAHRAEYIEQEGEEVEEKTKFSFETKGILGHIFGGKTMTANGVLLNFALLSICFAINHGAITSFIFIGNLEYKELGAYFTGTLYITYVLIALTIGSALVEKFRPHKSISAGLLIYTLYIVAYTIVGLAPGKVDILWKKIMAVILCAIAGVAAGYVWTAWGTFLTQSAHAYSVLSGTDKKKATRVMAGCFAAVYVFFEFVGKLATTPIFYQGFGASKNDKADNSTPFGYLSLLYTCIALFGGVLTLVFVRDVPVLAAKAKEEDELGNVQASNSTMIVPPTTSQKFLRKIILALLLVARRPVILLLMPLQISFGFSAAFTNGFLGSEVLKKAVQGEFQGYIGSVIPATATVVALAIGAISTVTGHSPMLLTGAFVFTVVPIILISVPLASIISLKSGVVIFYIIQGVGRAIFESTNKAIVSETFAADSEAAFANVVFFSGTATIIGYFLFPHLSVHGIAGLCIAVGSLSFACLSIFFFFTKVKADVDDTDDEIEPEKERLINEKI